MPQLVAGNYCHYSYPHPKEHVCVRKKCCKMGNGPSKTPSCSFHRTITPIVKLSTIWEAFHKKFDRACVLKHNIVDIYTEERKFEKFCVLRNVFQNNASFHIIFLVCEDIIWIWLNPNNFKSNWLFICHKTKSSHFSFTYTKEQKSIKICLCLKHINTMKFSSWTGNTAM